MQTLFISEIFEKLGHDPKLATRNAKIVFLQKHYSIAMETVIRGLFDKDIIFFCDSLPPYTPDDAPLGTNPGSIYSTWREFRVWLKDADDSKRSVKERHMIQKLESMDEKECKVIEAMIKKSPNKYKSLTRKLIEETFPGMLQPEN